MRAAPGLRKLRLRHKLALWLAVAALVAVVITALVAVRIVLGSLDAGLRKQTARQLSIALNLVLRQVEALGNDAGALASSPSLVAALESGNPSSSVSETLGRQEAILPSSLVQVTDARGNLLDTRVVGRDTKRFLPLALGPGSAVFERGLSYERRVDIVPLGDKLVVRAVAPVVTASLALRGVVVVSAPLDGDFADQIKGALGAEVLLHAGGQPAQSTFADRQGARLQHPVHQAGEPFDAGMPPYQLHLHASGFR